MKSSFLAITPPKNGDSSLYDLKRQLAADEKCREILAFPPVLRLGTLPSDTELSPHRAQLTEMEGLQLHPIWEKGIWMEHSGLFLQCSHPGSAAFWSDLFPRLSWSPDPGIFLGLLPRIPRVSPKTFTWKSWRLIILEAETKPDRYQWRVVKEINKKASP